MHVSAKFLQSFISFQVPSFAWRSNVLSDLHHVSQDNRICVKTPVASTQMQPYHLESRKQHPYSSLDDVLINEKIEKKQYYDLNSKKHHQYQPDPKLYQQEQAHEPDSGHVSHVKELKEVLDGEKEESKLENESTRAKNGINRKLKIVKNKNKNGRIVIVMSKYMENGKQPDGVVKQNQLLENHSHDAVEKTKHFGNSYNEDDRNEHAHHAVAKELQIGETSQLMKNSGSGSSENAVHKRHHSEPSSDRPSAKSFLCCRSTSTQNAKSSSQDQSKASSLYRHHSSTFGAESCQEEPMDLSFTGSRGARNAVTDCQTNGPSNPEKEEMSSALEPECTSSFAPFLGNIIITDVTANCLTVTFKEYIPVGKPANY